MLKALFTWILTIKHSLRQATKKDFNLDICYANDGKVMEQTTVVGQTKDVGFQIGCEKVDCQKYDKNAALAIS